MSILFVSSVIPSLHKVICVYSGRYEGEKGAYNNRFGYDVSPTVPPSVRTDSGGEGRAPQSTPNSGAIEMTFS